MRLAETKTLAETRLSIGYYNCPPVFVRAWHCLCARCIAIVLQPYGGLTQVLSLISIDYLWREGARGGELSITSATG